MYKVQVQSKSTTHKVPGSPAKYVDHQQSTKFSCTIHIWIKLYRGFLALFFHFSCDLSHQVVDEQDKKRYTHGQVVLAQRNSNADA